MPAAVPALELVHRVVGDADPHSIAIESEIPQTRGLGSSAALLVAACAAVLPELGRDQIFARAARAEGHPDNVAAATHGGLVAVSPTGRVGRLVVHPSLHVVVAIPDEELATSRARAVVATEVPRDVAVRTSARLAMLIEGLRSGEPDQLASALGDEMHEAPRRALTETPARLIESALEAGALYAAWSGAGPSVIAFAGEDSLDAVGEAMGEVLGDGGDVRELGIDRQGVRIE